MMFEGLYEYLKRCPELTGQRFNFDYVGASPIEWGLNIPTNDPLLSKSINGDTKNKLDFYLMANQAFGEDVLNNIDNLEIFQRIKEWFVEQNNAKVYPDLGAGKKVTGVYALTEGYGEKTTANTGLYQIQCRVEYDQASTSPRQMPRWL